MKEYDVELGVPTTVLLDDEDAQAQGLDPASGRDVPDHPPVDVVQPYIGAPDEIQAAQADEPQTKKRTASNK